MNRVRDEQRAGWLCTIAGRPDKFEKESCENLSERKHILEDLAFKIEEFYSFCQQWPAIYIQRHPTEVAKKNVYTF